MASFFTKLFGAGANNLVDVVGDALDKTITSDEERKALENEISLATMRHDLAGC